MSDATLPPVYCLTLPEEPWKSAAALAHFASHGITPTLLHGFHGMLTGLRPTNPFQFNDDGTPEYMHVAQVGCYLSHLLMLKAALASGASEFICCEDDVELVEHFAAHWLHLRPTIPDTTGVVQIEYTHTYFNGAPVPLTPYAPGLARCTSYAHCAAAIWWRRDAAALAVQLLRPVDAPFDISLMRKVYPFVGHALCDPPLATQRTAHGHWPSSIGCQAGKNLDAWAKLVPA